MAKTLPLLDLNVAAAGTGNPFTLSNAAVILRMAEPAQNNGKKEVVFIMDNVADWQTIAADIKPGIEVVLLDNSQDGLTQMAVWAQDHRGYDAIHIISHGSSGSLLLGSTTLTSTNLNSYASQLAGIGNSLAENGDILLYGCSIASGLSGVDFIGRLAQATGADIAASNNTTGASSLGGDWILENSTGLIDAGSMTISNYSNLLAGYSGTFNFDTGYTAINQGDTSWEGSINSASITQGGFTLMGTATSGGVNIEEADFPSDGSSELNFGTVGNGTSGVKVVFSNNETFDISSLQIFNWSGDYTAFKITGYKGATEIGSVTTNSLPDPNNTGGNSSNTNKQTVTLNFTDIDTILVTLASGGQNGSYAFSLDNIVVANVQAVPSGPTVSSVTSSAENGSYSVGDVIIVTVQFSETVTVTGTPQLTLETGSTDRIANYSSGSGGSTLSFTYTVQAGDTAADLDYTGTGALALNGGTINATTGGAAAILTLAAPGTVNSLGANKAIVIDTTAPGAPSTPDMTVGTDSGSSSTDNITNDTTPTFTGTAEVGSTVTLYDTDGTTSLGSATTDGSGNWSITSSALGAGAHTLTAKATDAAGNVSAASSGLSITIDTTAPTTTVSTVSFSADTGTSSTDFVTSTAAQTISGTLSAVTVTGEIVEVSLDNGSTWATATNTIGQNTWSLAGQTLSGNNTLQVRVTDAAGNSGTALSQAYVLDQIAPAITFSALSFSADTGTSSTDFITNTVAQTIGATLSAGLGDGDIVYGSLDNGSTWSDITAKVSGTTLIWDGVTLAASNTLKLKVTDSAGNDGTVKSQSYVLDQVAPSITTISIPNTTMKVGDTVTATITVADDGGTTYTLGSSTIDGFSLSNLVRTNSTTYTAQFTVTEGGADVAADNDIPISIVLTDPAGNSNAAYTTAIAQAGDVINAHSPTDIALGNSSVSVIAGVNAVVGALSSTDGSSGDTFTYSLVAGAGDTNNASFNISGGNLRVTDAGTLTAGNSYSVRVQTTDAAGNSYQEALTVNAVANNSPTIDLNGGGAGTGNSVTLANAAAGLAAATATVGDSENDSANWDTGSLTVQRVTGGVSDGSVNDVFSFTGGGSFSATGTIAKGADSSGTLVATAGSTQFATWNYTSATGKLDIAFDADTTSALVQDVVRHVGYSNDTPYGDATIRMALNDGSSTTNADITVTSNVIHVTQTDYDTDGDTADGLNLYEALAIAKDGDTILLHDGVYRGQFDISKAVTINALNGANGNVTIESPDSADLVGVAPEMLTNNGRWRMPVINVHTPDPDQGTVTIKNITINGRDQGLADGFANNKDLLGIGIVNSNAVIDNVTLTNFRSTDSGEWGWGENFPILAEADSSLTNKVSVTIQNSDISNFQKTAIVGWGPMLDITVDTTTITGSGVDGISGQNGMQIGSGGLRTGTTATLTNNTIQNFGFVNDAYGASGILLVYADDTTITGNTFTGALAGAGTFTGINIMYPLDSGTEINISGNSFADADQGIFNESDVAYVLTVGNNNFSGTGVAVQDSYHITDPATETPSDNDITITLASTVAPASGSLKYYLYNGDDSFTDTGSVDSAVYGGEGNDTITTGSGDDILAGGLGVDTLTGGDGEDVFLYKAQETNSEGDLVIYDITDFGTDTITDFGTGDLIRVTGRASTGGTVTVGDGTAVAANSVQISVSGGTTTLYIDSDATNDVAEIELHLTGTYTTANFQLDGTDIRYVSPPPPVDPPVDPPVTPPVDPPVDPPADDDNDGIPADTENQVPSLPPSDGGTAVVGDGNGDGVPDNQQTNVTSVPFLNTNTAVSNPGGAAPIYITLVADATAGVPNSGDDGPTQLTSVQQLDAPGNLPDTMEMPLGLIAFTANTPTIGMTETFSLFVDGSVTFNGYWKQNAAGVWTNLATAIETVGTKTRIDFAITDGGEFDADGLANGIIVDPGAIGSMPLSLVGILPVVSETGFWF